MLCYAVLVAVLIVPATLVLSGATEVGVLARSTGRVAPVANVTTVSTMRVPGSPAPLWGPVPDGAMFAAVGGVLFGLAAVMRRSTRVRR